jgi:hypothetical protein
MIPRTIIPYACGIVRGNFDQAPFAKCAEARRLPSLFWRHADGLRERTAASDVSPLARTGQDIVNYVLSRRADMRIQAELAYMRDVRFRGLCDDYGEAIEARERWRRSSLPSAAQRVAEYTDLVAGLEEEILSEIRNYCDLAAAPR